MFLFIGILMSVIQGGYVRRIKQEKQMTATIRVNRKLSIKFKAIFIRFLYFLRPLIY